MRTVYKTQCEVVGQWGHQDVAIFEGKVYRIRQCPNSQMVNLLDQIHRTSPDQVRRQLTDLQPPKRELPRWKQQVNQHLKYRGIPPMYR